MEYFIGTIIPWTANYEPYGWFYCDGRQLPISQWSNLFGVIGFRYGGDGQNYFNLPDLKGRVAVGATASTANTGGSETVTLSTTNIPSHSHNIQANTNATVAGSNTPDSNKGPGVSKLGLGATQLYRQYTNPNDLVSLNSNTINSFGAPGAHDNLQPFLAISYIICVYGEFPVRP